VASLAEQELYFFIPDLFNLARGATDAAAFDAALRSLVTEKYYEFGKALAKAGKHGEALELFTEGLKYDSDKNPSQAQGAKDPAAFDAALRSLVAEKYYECGKDLAKNGKHAEAVELFTEGLKYASDNKSALQKALEASRKELPPAEKPD
jgi:tetratricopeptide (TPR) repeat protein